ncbi:NAD(P)-dependent oxidoreductase [bacterium]|nr:NAD(P)-dependent oxidoreductase [bacterium]
MKTAVIGHTGFVGSNIIAQSDFDDFYNSKNIFEIKNKKYDLVVCSGISAVKWLANKEPQNDWNNIKNLLDCLKEVECGKFILISTVDVYPDTNGVDEDSIIDAENLQPYGKHRLMAEQFVEKKFDSLIVRLPGLFGKGLKKNAIYDFIHNNQIDKIHSQAVFQFYYLDNICKDIQTALKSGIKVINFAAEPISIYEIAKEAFGFEFTNICSYPPPYYNFKTKYHQLYGGKDGYIYTKMEIIESLRVFLREEGYFKK